MATKKRRYLVTLTLEDPYTDDGPLSLKEVREVVAGALADNSFDLDVKKVVVKKETT